MQAGEQTCSCAVRSQGLVALILVMVQGLWWWCRRGCGGGAGGSGGVVQLTEAAEGGPTLIPGTMCRWCRRVRC